MLNAIAPPVSGTWAERLTALTRDSRDTLFLLMVVAWVLMPQVGNLPLWCSLMAGAVLLWRGKLALSGQALPGRWWLLGLLALSIGATLLTHKTLLGRDAGVTLIVVLLALKTLELRAKRDAFVIFFLSFFMMLTNFFFSQSLLTAGAMLIGLMGLLTALVNAHMPVGKPPLRHAARIAGSMALLGAPIMVTLFMLFPRIGPLWGIPADGMSGRSGLSGSMQVGTIASLALDDSIAMRVKFEGEPPPQSSLYFRGPVFTRFDGREWLPLRPAGRFQTRQMPSQLQVTGRGIDYEVTMEPSNRPWLIVLDAAIDPPRMAGKDVVMTDELVWLTTDPITDITRYKARSYTDFRYGPVRAGTTLMEYEELPPGTNPRTRALAQDILNDPRNAKGDALSLSQAVMERLRTGGYTYTLEPGVYGANTADEFWFDKKEGFCEHIASAYVVLMRAMDIPARIVTGYQGGSRNSVDGYWTLRQSDAHAWAEIWQEGQGWTRVDPTSAVSPGRIGSLARLQPPRGVLANAIGNMSPDLAEKLRATWDAVNNRWNQWVLNYTQSKQLDLLKDLGFESPDWEDLSYVLIGVIVLVSLLGAAWAMWERSQHDPWLRLLEQARRALRQAGLELSPTAAPRAMAGQVQRHFGAAGTAWSGWLLRLEALRYAPAHAQTQSLGTLRQEFRRLRTTRSTLRSSEVTP